MADDTDIADDPSTWDPALDAVVAAPANHKVLYENERLRVLEVILGPDEEEPVHHHRWPSVFVFDQVQPPLHDFTPDGVMLPPNRDVIRAVETGTGGDVWWCTWHLSRPDGFSTPPASLSMASA